MIASQDHKINFITLTLCAPNRFKGEFKDGRQGGQIGNGKIENLDGDSRTRVGAVVVDDHVIGQNDDVVLDFLGDTLGPGRGKVQPDGLGHGN